MISKTKKTYFKVAKQISMLSNHRCKIGCVVVKNHRIISSGHNSATETHAIKARIDKKYFGFDCPGYLHAETDTLLPLIREKTDLTNATVFVYRKLKNGAGLSRPCQRCMKLIKSLGIKKINYSTDYGYCEEEI